VRKVAQAHAVSELLRALNSGRSLEYVAAELGVSRAHLYQWMRDARVVRVGGRGQYAVVHWKNTRQLSLF
jgi:transposase-like protein